MNELQTTNSQGDAVLEQALDTYITKRDPQGAVAQRKALRAQREAQAVQQQGIRQEKQAVQGQQLSVNGQQMLANDQHLRRVVNDVLGAKQQLDQDIRSVDWQALEIENPALAVNLRQKMLEHKAIIDRRGMEISQVLNAHQQNAFEVQMQALAQALVSEIPAWRKGDGTPHTDQIVKDVQEMHRIMLERGYTEAEISKMTDPRDIVSAYDLMQAEREGNRARIYKGSLASRRGTLNMNKTADQKVKAIMGNRRMNRKQREHEAQKALLKDFL